MSSLLVLSYENFREFLDKMCRCDGMVDVADSKSPPAGRNKGSSLNAAPLIRFSTDDKGKDFLGKGDHNAACYGEHTVGALGWIMALERQAHL